MRVTRIDQTRNYQIQIHKAQEKVEDDYRKKVEKRAFDRIVAERAARNIRLDLDKGRKIDVEC